MTIVNIYIGDGCVTVDHPPHLSLAKIGPFAEQDLPHGPEYQPMVVELTTSQQVSIEYGPPVDKKGYPTTVQDGSAVWHSSDDTVAQTQIDNTNPLKALVIAGAPGVAEVWLVADADLGGGVTPITSDKTGIQVVAGQATAFGAPNVGVPVEQPTATKRQ